MRYTHKQVTKMASNLVKKHGSITAAAAAIGCDRAQMSRAAAGIGSPAPAVLQALGLEREVVYVKS